MCVSNITFWIVVICAISTLVTKIMSILPGMHYIML
jgi:hypothetical protein